MWKRPIRIGRRRFWSSPKCTRAERRIAAPTFRQDRGVAAGETTRLSRIGALARGLSPVTVYARPRWRFCRRGTKSSNPEAAEPGQICDINRFTISAVVAENGGIPVAQPPAPDTLDALSQHARGARRARHRRVFGRQFRRRARFDSRCDRGTRHPPLSRRRRENQASRTASPSSEARPCLRCRGIPHRACPMRTCCSSPCSAALRVSVRKYNTTLTYAAGKTRRIGGRPPPVLYRSN